MVSVGRTSRRLKAMSKIPIYRGTPDILKRRQYLGGINIASVGQEPCRRTRFIGALLTYGAKKLDII